MDQQRALHSGCLVSGVRTPPIRRNSKLATLGRIFKPWKWRKKKNEKLKQNSTALERKVAMMQTRDELVRKELVEIMEKGETQPACVETLGKVTSPPALRNSVLPKEQDFATKLSESHNATLRGQHSTPTGSPHLVIEELHRALATKHRQDSFHGKEVRGSPKRRNEGRLSRTSSAEVPIGATGDSECKVSSIKVSDENKENVRVEECWTDASGLPHDQDSWNESVISGTLPRKMRKELLAVKLRNRPSKQELEDRNIFPVRSDEERQEILTSSPVNFPLGLIKCLSVQRNDQTEQEERREIKQRLNRKLNQRPTVDELRDRKILIRFSDYVEVAKAQDYDRRADKPWTRLSAADKAAIRKELNEYKSNEMEVHASSKHLTR
uniref:Phosphatase and actin regulator n=1 Tax=Erpetoichthys calabaricus TaxID=27687 RepID=A0A8C4S5R8_ERPCA